MYFPPGHSGPETFYRGDALVPGEYEDYPEEPPIQDTSCRYILAIPEEKVDRLRLLLKKATNTIEQRAMYLSVKGELEFVIATRPMAFWASARAMQIKGKSEWQHKAKKTRPRKVELSLMGSQNVVESQEKTRP